MFYTHPGLLYVCAHQLEKASFFHNGIRFNTFYLKGKFSSGIEGALASTFNITIQLETTIRNDSLNLSFDVFKVYLSNNDS